MEFSGKTALVTGGSRGIGRAVALALAGKGMDVAVNYLRNEDAAKETVYEARKPGVKALACKADVSRFEEVKAMFAETEEELGPVDVLVNNAGFTSDNLLTFMKREQWQEVIDTDLTGAFYCTKTAAREMARRRRGCIVNISSDAALAGDVMRANYSSAKAGMLGLTRTAARELAGSGIRVNAVAPGFIDTDLTASLPESRKCKQLETVPMARAGLPGEVAAAVLFLVSDDAAYITGQVLRVDGGMCM
ncbi:MAG: beta-ketoacyl-ACP reductase [Kiritimatiellia bacterium]